MAHTIIIAEIGECFNGDFEIARKMIQESKFAGCDIVKFQTLDFENICDQDPEYEWFKRIALNPEKINFLIDCARTTGIDILFTPENVKTAQWLIDKDLTSVKIASSCIADKELISFIKKNFRCVFMSTGMATLDEINYAVNIFQNIETLYILHCISEYPTGPLLEIRGLKALSSENVRLNMMKMLIELYPQHKIGYSDHTDGIIAPVAAVAVGAKVIEKHITLDRQTPVNNYHLHGEYLGTDHILSIEPAELREMVTQIRTVEKMMGDWKWERSEGEEILKTFLRERFSNG